MLFFIYVRIKVSDVLKIISVFNNFIAFDPAENRVGNSSNASSGGFAVKRRRSVRRKQPGLFRMSGFPAEPLP